MKNKLYSLLTLCLLILGSIGQALSQTHDNGYVFDLDNYKNYEQRIQMCYYIMQDDRFDLMIEEDYSYLHILPSREYQGHNFKGELDTFLKELEYDFEEHLEKEKELRTSIFLSWKKNIPADINNFLVLDYYNREIQTNNTCATADPFCTTDVYSFPAGVNSGSGETGPYYDCLTTRPNPAWYYMKIGTPGNINIHMESSPARDIDFCCWGPFSDPTQPCPNGLTQQKVVSCSYSTSYSETCQIPASAQTGEYYIMVITNYSNQACDITFSKSGGSGTTDCGILPPIVSGNSPLCVGETIRLSAAEISGASYSWTGPGGWTSTLRNPTRPNATLAMSGTYNCVITQGTQTSEAASVQIEVKAKPIANFTFTQVCKGSPTTFTCTSTTSPSGHAITSRTWNFGDGSTGNGANVTHTYANAGTYTVTLTTKTANGVCTNSKSQQVVVHPMPQTNAGPDQTINYGAMAQLTGTAGIGSYTYQWSPANMVQNPNSLNTMTVPLTSNQTFTLTATSTAGNCSKSDQVIIAIQGSGMTGHATADHPDICEGESTTLHANPSGGTGNFTYSWSPAATLNNPNIANPVATPGIGTTTYTVAMSDGVTTVNASVTVTVHPETEETRHVSICPGDSYNFNGIICSTPGTYTYDSINENGCRHTIILELNHYPTYTTNIEATICDGETYDFFGQSLYLAGNNYQHTLQSIHGCDSIIRLTLNVNPSDETYIDASICENGSYPFFGQYLTEEGQYTHVVPNQYGCDSTVILNLSITDKYYTYKDIHTCESSYYWAGADTLITDNGVYYHTFPSTAGCDSIVEYTLWFEPSFYNEYVETHCDSYTWNATGETYTQSGTYVKEEKTQWGCDNIKTLYLTINNSETNTINKIACDSYTWNDETYYEDGNYIQYFSNTLGCDSTVTTKLDIEYTPSIAHMSGPDYVLSGNNFQINIYDYCITLDNPRCQVDSVVWNIDCHRWVINPYDNGFCCKLYVTSYESERVTLTATAYNRCGTTEQEIKILSTFQNVEEIQDRIEVDIVPNPNNGQMTMHLQNVQGETNIKVYNTSGVLVDELNTIVDDNADDIVYSMKNIAEGIYFFRISNKEQVVTKKIVIINK